jgi:hypothetical protein
VPLEFQKPSFDNTTLNEGVFELHMFVVLWLAINTTKFHPSKNIQDSHSRQTKQNREANMRSSKTPK